MSLPIDELVARQARAFPNRLAVRAADGEASYGELQGLIDGVAEGLARQHVQTDDIVAVLMPRSWRLPAALLGVLRAGAAYLPLDPLYPAERLQGMVRDAGVATVITDRTLAQAASQLAASVIEIEHTPPSSSDSVSARARSDGLAYVIYTSGSTGRPKGVEIPHSALSTFVEAFVERPGLSQHDRVLAIATVCFDIAVVELLAPLTVGGSIVIASNDTAREPRALSDALSRHDVSVLQATPTTWRMLLDAGAVLPGGLRKFCGGEMLSRRLADLLLETGGELWNLYGPTEATVWCTAQRIVSTSEGISIGTPLQGVRIAILDQDGRPIEDDSIGEIAVGGGALARGYRNLADLTRQRFVCDPAAHDGLKRLYRTGDLGRWRPDGTLECLGRTDDQVKIDGFRIELGEIEHALEQHPTVQRAIVAAEPVAEEGSQLVAYVLPSNRSAPEATELGAALRLTLPAYMLPARYLRIRELPLTPSGKVDRPRLPVLADGPLGATTCSRPPSSAIERRLHRIWCALLDVRHLGVDDDYFALGGRSLAAARMFARIESEFGVRLPLATLLEAPTVAMLARKIEEGAASQNWEPLVCLQPHGAGPPLFVVHLLGGNVVSYQALVTRLGGERPIYGLQARGLSGVEKPLTTIESMAALYIGEIARLQADGPLLLAGASFGGLVAFEMARQTVQTGRQVAFLGIMDTDYPDIAAWAAPLYERSPQFRAWMYPTVQRVRGHVRAIQRMGPRQYWREVVLGTAPDPTIVARDDPQEAGGPVQDGILDVIRANEAAERHYIPRPYPGRLTFFRAAGRADGPAGLASWRQVAEHVEVVDVPGNHHTMRFEPHVATLAAELRSRLAAMEARE